MTMEVILSQDVERLGRAGQVIKVKDGYARNFLFPNALAVPMNAANLKRLEQEKKNKSLQGQKLLREAQAFKDTLGAISLTIPVLTKEDETLYGSITAQEVSAALKEDGVDLDKKLIALAEPIKALGIYEIPVNLHPEVTTKLKIWVVKK